MTTRRAVVYARISLSTEESVSITRQLDAATKYAEARGWEVVGTFRDDGVSATKNKPEDRPGWQALLAATGYDTVIIWKVDRLARRVLDFLHADAALQERGAAIVAVEDPIDMSTATGRAFATMLAVFGEMEAEAIRARTKAARHTLLTNGRWPGGKPPFGYRVVANPTGAGKVVVQDPDTVETLRAIVDRTVAGYTVHSTMRWLTDRGVPSPGGSTWTYNTVYRLLHHPLLAGMIPHNPGRGDRKTRGDGVVRGSNGLPVVHDHLAVMEVGQWRAMVARLDDPTVDPRRTPRALCKRSDGLLSGLLWCNEGTTAKGIQRHTEPVRMHRGTKQQTNGTSYSCPSCHMTLSNVDGLVVAAFLAERGDTIHLDAVEEVVDGMAAEHAEATVRLQELSAQLATATGDEFAALLDEIGKVKAVQAEAAAAPAVTVLRQAGGRPTQTFAEDWADAGDDEERRRAVLGHALRRVLVTRGRQGEKSDAAKLRRMAFEWVPAGQTVPPDDAQVGAVA